MPEIWKIILIHQLIFQGMFIIKNIFLRKKIGQQIRGKNIEATLSILYFAGFIGAALIISTISHPVGEILLLDETYSMLAGPTLLFINLIISAASLINLKDSWRVGVLEDQKTELITSGIYRFTRNPYFVSYFLMFAAYTILLQNLILLFLSLLGFIFVHKMIKKEEDYLSSIHGNAYTDYKTKVARYIII